MNKKNVGGGKRIQKNIIDWRVGALALVSLFCFSCSTQVVPDVDSESYASTSYDAYSACVRHLVQYGQERQCDDVKSSDGRGLSYGEYYGVNYQEPSASYQVEDEYYSKLSGSKQALTTTASSKKLSSYFRYLSVVDSDAREDIIATWKSLSEQGQN